MTGTETLTLTEAAAELGITPDGLLDFDQSLNGDWDHEFTRAEVEQLRHVLANLDENGAYTEKMALIGYERALIDKLSKALHMAARKVGDYKPLSETQRGNTFEVRIGVDGDRVARVTIELDRITQDADRD